MGVPGVKAAFNISWKRHLPSRLHAALAVFQALLGKAWRRTSLFCLCSTLSGLAEASVLAITAQVANGLATGRRGIDGSVGPITIHASLGTLLAIGGALALFRLALQLPISYIPARMSADVQADTRRRLVAAFTTASWSLQAEDKEGHFQELATAQTVQATNGTVQAATLINAILAFAILLVSALVLDPAAAAIVLVAAVGLFSLLRPLTVAVSRQARRLSESQLAFAGGVSEANRLAEETQVYGVAASQIERVDGLIERAAGFFFRLQVLLRLAPNIYQSAIYLMLVGGLAAVFELTSGNVASLGGVVLLLVRAGAYGNQVQTSYQLVRQAMPFVDRLQSAESRYRLSPATRGDTSLDAVETIAFDRVSFAYGVDRHDVLQNVSFHVGRGDAIGIVGPSGAGKSTLAQILLRLRAPSSGRYVINGVNADELRSDQWHRKVAYVPQTPNLLHASVAENIRFFRDIPHDDVVWAATAARVHDDVVGWRDGYDTLVGPRADAVSGGQAQRICFARALAGHPEVLILDEPTSALDPRSERLIQESLVGLKGSVTLFIIAHRMSTLDMCNRIMVIVDGRLDAFEPFATLLESNAYYQSATEAAAPTTGSAVSAEPE